VNGIDIDDAIEPVFVGYGEIRIIGVLHSGIFVLIIVGVHANDVSPGVCEE